MWKISDKNKYALYSGSMETLLFKKAKTLSEVVDSFLFALKSVQYSPASLETYRYVLGMFKQSIGETRQFSSLDADDIRKFLMEKEHLANKTICNYYIVLSSLWTWAVKNEYAKEHIVRKVNKPKYIKKKLPSFTEREVRMIFNVCSNEREKAIVMVLLDTGMRASELCALTVDDWWPGNLHIRNGKGGKERDVPISETTEKAIFNQLKKRTISDQGFDSGSALFSSDYPTIPLSYESLRYFMKKLEKRSSVHDVHAHKFRHTFAVNFLRNNGNVYALKEIMGHENLETTELYLDLVHSDFTDAHRIASPVTNMRLGISK